MSEETTVQYQVSNALLVVDFLALLAAVVLDSRGVRKVMTACNKICTKTSN